MLTFAHATFFFCLPLPFFVWWLLPARTEVRSAVLVPFLARLQSASAGDATIARQRQGSSFLVSVLVWICLVIALARPQWLEPPIEKLIPTRDLMLLVDLSGSMQQEDFTDSEGNSVDRLFAVKNVLGDFLIQREGDRVGLIVFGNAAFLQVPFTADLSLCQQLLDETQVGMAGPKTSLGDAIGLGIQLFDESDVPNKTMIALTDGNDTGSSVPPHEAARIAADRGITIHTVAIGDPTTVGEERLDRESLRAVAAATGGDDFLAMDRGELARIYDRIDAIEPTEVKTITRRPRTDLYYWPLVVALLLSFAVHAAWIFVESSRAEATEQALRLRVNARTFELETVEQ